MRLSNAAFGFLLFFPGLLIIIAFVAFPAGYLVFLSFNKFKPGLLVPLGEYTIDNYIDVLQDEVFLASIPKMFYFSVGSTFLSLFGGLILAHTLNRIQKGATLFRTLTIIPWAVPFVFSGYVWSWMLSSGHGPIPDILLRLGIISKPIDVFANPTLSLLAVIVADAWPRIPFLCVIILAGLTRIPQDIYEAAKIDGANAIQMFRRISLPLNQKPTLIAFFITWVFSMRALDAIFAMTPGGGAAHATYTLAYYVFDRLYLFADAGRAAAAAIFLILMTFVFAIIFIRSIRER